MVDGIVAVTLESDQGIDRDPDTDTDVDQRHTDQGQELDHHNIMVTVADEITVVAGHLIQKHSQDVITRMIGTRTGTKVDANVMTDDIQTTIGLATALEVARVQGQGPLAIDEA